MLLRAHSRVQALLASRLWIAARGSSLLGCLLLGLCLAAPVAAQQPPEEEGVCARVRIKISQEVAITRTAFRATLEINNSAYNVRLENVRVNLDIRGPNREVANDLFGIRPPQLTGINDVSGNGFIDPGTTATAVWTIIPTRDAAPDQPVQYLVGGEFSYTQDGQTMTMPLFPANILVRPDPLLVLDYFLVRDVYGDDPFTPQIEPAEPYPLGLIMRNTGKGEANNVRITSSQPEIIENEKGLLIEFKIIGTRVNDEPQSPSLTVNLGNIGPGQTSVAQWLMTSSLQGKFIEYSATFEHLDSLGDARLSLIDSVNIHELTHVVRVDLPDDDRKPDFLVNDYADPDHLPDTLYSSDGTTAGVVPETNATVGGPVTLQNLQVPLSAVLAQGWAYLRTDDPGQEQFRLARVMRSDGREIRVPDNAWTTHRTIRLKNQPPYREHRLHLFDKDSTGSYTLVYEASGIPVRDGKLMPDGQAIALGGAEGIAVTAVYPDCFYVESDDRTSGMRVVWTGDGVSVGSRVAVRGVMITTDEFERALQAVEVAAVGGPSVIEPMALNNKALGGCDLSYDAETGAGQRGVEYCQGANNIGLLVKTFGRVKSVGSDFFYVDDGTGAWDGSIFRGVRVRCAGLEKPEVGEYVSVTGISSIMRVGDRLFRSIKPRGQADIEITTP